MSSPGDSNARVMRREFAPRLPETDEAIAALSAESQAALRQLSLERTMGYGVDYADATQLRARVLGGESWQSAATSLADLCLQQTDSTPVAATRPTRITGLRRASALLRMGQMMMLTDTEERRAIFAQAAQRYAQAAALQGDRKQVTIATESGSLAGWLLSGGGNAVASAIVIGGIEGWAMDFDSLGEALAARGIDALMLDGPGQGQTRLLHQHFLSAQWRDAYRAAIDYLDQRAPGRPIGFVGNSMGGSFAMAVAVGDTRIAACCNNGGIIAPWMVPQSGAFFSKMVAFCGVEAQQAVDIWKTVTPVQEGPNTGYPLLMLQGGKDPLVSIPMSEMLLLSAPTDDKQMVIFSDGDHCLYNHRSDRDALIADWMYTRLGGSTPTETPPHI